MQRLKSALIALALTGAGGVSAEPSLLMAEEHGCYWCARWDAEIAPIYPKTAEGRTAPLKRFDIHAKAPDVAFARPVIFTPTFILVEDGQELGRIEGYPGEDFFWGLLGALFERANLNLTEES